MSPIESIVKKVELEKEQVIKKPLHTKGWNGLIRKEVSLTRLFEPGVFLPPITEHCRDQLKKNVGTIRSVQNTVSDDTN